MGAGMVLSGLEVERVYKGSLPKMVCACYLRKWLAGV
jgi:hypothetical protein